MVVCLRCSVKAHGLHLLFGCCIIWEGSDAAVCHCDKSGRSCLWPALSCFLWHVFEIFVPWGWGQKVSPKRCNSSAEMYDVTCKKYVILTSVYCGRNGRNWQLSGANYNALPLYSSQLMCCVKENKMSWKREYVRQTFMICVYKSRIGYKKKESGCGRNLKNKNVYGTPLRVCAGVARVPIMYTGRLTDSRPVERISVLQPLGASTQQGNWRYPLYHIRTKSTFDCVINDLFVMEGRTGEERCVVIYCKVLSKCSPHMRQKYVNCKFMSMICVPFVSFKAWDVLLE
jgi:hypothetical protein